MTCAEALPTVVGLTIGALASVFLGLAYGIDPLSLLLVIKKASFGSLFALEDTLSRAAPLLLTGLAAVIPARAGLIVLGADASLLLAALGVAVISLSTPTALGAIGIAMLLGIGAVIGAALMTLVGLLRHHRGVNEVISSLLFVFITIAIFNFLVENVLRSPAATSFPHTQAAPAALRIGKIPGFETHWGLLIGIAVCLMAGLFTSKTTLGFAARIVGGNIRAAQTLGIPVGAHIIWACAACGALAGLAGGLEVLAVHGHANAAIYGANFGFTGVLVAFLARYNPFMVIPAAVLIGALSAASGLVQRSFEAPGAFMLVVQGMVFVAILAAETLRRPIRARVWRMLS